MLAVHLHFAYILLHALVSISFNCAIRVRSHRFGREMSSIQDL